MNTDLGLEDQSVVVTPTKLSFPNRSDAGNAEFLVETFRDKLRYDPHTGHWFFFSHHTWEQVPQEQLLTIAKEAMRLRHSQAGLIADPVEKQKERGWARASESIGRLSAMITIAKGDKRIQATEWDRSPYLLAVANGVVNLETGRLGAGKPEQLIRTRSTVVWDPQAQCPKWEEFLRQTFESEELIEYIQMAVGYTLTGLTSEQCFFLCYGTGANGKSTFLDTIQYVMGKYAHYLPFYTLELSTNQQIPNDLAPLPGKRLVSASEGQRSTRLNEARVKALTGGDEITARFLHKEFFTFRPSCKLWLFSNHLPEIHDESEGMWRRMRVIPFKHQVPDHLRDPRLAEKLQDEASGILRWAVAGAQKWLHQGLRTPQDVKAITDSYREESDLVGQFLKQHCDLGREYKETSKFLFEEFRGWLVSTGRDDIQFTSTSFGASLRAHGMESFKSGTVRGWRGVRLKPIGTGVRHNVSHMQPQDSKPS